MDGINYCLNYLLCALAVVQGYCKTDNDFCTRNGLGLVHDNWNVQNGRRGATFTDSYCSYLDSGV